MGGAGEDRALKGYIIFREGGVVSLDESTFAVTSEGGEGAYTVRRLGEGLWECDCADHRFRKADCKHIHAARLWRFFRAMERRAEA